MATALKLHSFRQRWEGAHKNCKLLTWFCISLTTCAPSSTPVKLLAHPKLVTIKALTCAPKKFRHLRTRKVHKCAIPSSADTGTTTCWTRPAATPPSSSPPTTTPTGTWPATRPAAARPSRRSSTCSPTWPGPGWATSATSRAPCSGEWPELGAFGIF